jgi:adenylate cyclase
MDVLSRIFAWLSEREAGISAVVSIAVLAGIVFAGVRSLLRRRAEPGPEKAPAGNAHAAPATDSSSADLDPFNVPGFEGRPAIAVLPFDNLSGDPDQEYFADGIAEDLITRLSTWREFPVIARNSSFTYKGRPVDVKQVSRELGARYIVEGSVRRSGDSVRIAAQLIDATTGHHLWAETYDRELQEIFHIQDEIAEAIACSVAPALKKSEWKRTLRKNPQELDAWGSHWRGWWHYSRYSRDENVKARLHFQRATELDPNFTWAFAGLSIAHCADVRNQWSESPAQSISQAQQAIRRATALEDDDTFVQYALGDLHQLTGQTESAIAAFERALELDPSYVYAFFHLGLTLATGGKPDKAIANIETAIRLSPKDPFFNMFCVGMSLAHAAAERYEESVHWAKRSLQVNSSYPPSYLVLAASHANSGSLDEARATVKQLLQLNPASSMTGFKAIVSGWDPVFAERCIDALRKAGLPE